MPAPFRRVHVEVGLARFLLLVVLVPHARLEGAPRPRGLDVNETSGLEIRNPDAVEA